MINKIVELWYKIPVPKISFKFRFQKRDDRNFQWYLDRKKYGFDERELWNLSSNMEMFINDIYGFKQTEVDIYNEPMGMVSLVTIYRDIINKNYKNIIPIVEYMESRIKAYLDWGCPMGSYYLSDERSFLDSDIQENEVKVVLKMLEAYRITRQIDKENFHLIEKYFYHFGW